MKTISERMAELHEASRHDIYDCLAQACDEWQASVLAQLERMQRTIQPMELIGKTSLNTEYWKTFEPPPSPHQPAFDAALLKLKSMTPQEVFQSSVDAGVHNPDGTLTEHYRDDHSDRKGRG